MNVRYPAVLSLTLAIVCPHAIRADAAGKAAHAKVRPAPPPAAGLYSTRALRRAKIILQLKLLELRSEHLERVRRAIERRLPVDEILKT